MNMNKFQILIEELRTDLIVFIDNDFTPVTDPGTILGFVSFLNKDDYELLQNKLDKIDERLTNLLERFRLELAPLGFTPEDYDYFESGEIVGRLERKGYSELSGLANEIQKYISENTDQQENELASTIMNFGLLAYSGYGSYVHFFESLRLLPKRKSVRIYKDLPGDKFNDFKQDITEVLRLKQNKFYLLIVDKLLTDQDGEEVISALKMDGSEANNFFSILFTSKYDEKINPEHLDQYFQMQIRKDDPQVIDKVSSGLALCAYATLFNKLYELKKQALDHANNLIVSSGKENMLYLADMAHAEGTTVFKVINDWFDLLTQKKISDELARENSSMDFSFIAGLTSLLNTDYLASGSRVSEDFAKEIQGLNSFELFDYNINQIHSPPASGDIYQIESELYILAGQDCDLVVRGKKASACRKEKLAELVKCNFFPVPLDDKKTDSETALTLNYFRLNDIYGSLNIEFNMRTVFDFRLLDLCTLNTGGNSSFSKNGLIERTVQRALPKTWLDYCPKLFEEILSKIKVLDFMRGENIKESVLSPDESFSLKYSVDDNSINFPVKRVARLKGEFREYFLQRYWEYKTRKGLDTISLYNRKEIAVDSLEYGFMDHYKRIETELPFTVWLQLTGNRDKNQDNGKLSVILSKSELSAILHEDHREHFNEIISEEITIKGGDYLEERTKFTFKKKYEDGKLSIIITVPYLNEITGTRFIGQKEIPFKKLFTPEFVSANEFSGDATYLVDGEEFPLFNNGKLQKMALVDLEKGVTLPSLKLTFQLDKETGTLRRLEFEDKQSE